jgi:hypothetical protein
MTNFTKQEWQQIYDALKAYEARQYGRSASTKLTPVLEKIKEEIGDYTDE